MKITGTTKRFQIWNDEGQQLGNGTVHKGWVTMYSHRTKTRVPFTTFEEALNEFAKSN